MILAVFYILSQVRTNHSNLFQEYGIGTVIRMATGVMLIDILILMQRSTS